MICAKCQRDVSNFKDVAKCVDCNSLYHASCCRIRSLAKLSSMSKKALSEWRCDECAQDVSSVSSDSASVMELLKGISAEMKESRAANQASFDSLEKSMASVQTALEDMKIKLLKVEEDNTSLKRECGELRAENVQLSKRVCDLEIDLSDIQQYSRNQNLEIRGVPVTNGEDIYAILEAVAKALEVRYNRDDISVAHRLPAPRSKSFHPNIVVQYVSRSVRAQWLAAAKKKRIRATDLAPALPADPVLIFEHLTPQNKLLLGRAKFYVKQGNFAFAWTRDGKVFIRKTTDARAQRVRSLDEVESEAGARDH